MLSYIFVRPFKSWLFVLHLIYSGVVSMTRYQDTEVLLY